MDRKIGATLMSRPYPLLAEPLGGSVGFWEDEAPAELMHCCFRLGTREIRMMGDDD